MGHSTKLLTPTQTDGDTFTDDISREVCEKLTGYLERVVTEPIVLWGEWAMQWYGVPVFDNHMHLLVPDNRLSKAYEELKKAGFTDTPVPLLPVQPGSRLDPNTRWDELGPSYRISHPQFCHIGTTRPLCVLIQGYSAADSTFHITSSDDEHLKIGQADPRLFLRFAGLSVPHLPILASSFLRSYFSILRKQKAAEAAQRDDSSEGSSTLPPISQTRSMLKVWISYVKFYGYHPLGESAMRVGEILAPGIDEEMATFWERGY